LERNRKNSVNKMAGNEGRKEKEIDLKELANLDSLGDILTELKSSCVEQIQEKASLLWDTIESNVVEANEILFGETTLPSEIPITGKQQVQEIKTRLENRDNDVHNANVPLGKLKEYQRTDGSLFCLQYGL